ncbi:antibiotic biosynthesis monooxygenase family protein [Streptomyces catenulae]|uniref:Antibiotic biosynthesis monooxygenase n=1 Tax=Streptomyces catenulae TaxID=66875 RepID=A0ABV2YVD5_9ACTN|nr:antibiotic biosynthesis monooxygenase [Streptomyces catenulae]
MTRTSVFPEVRRADAGTVLISRWIVPDPAVQVAVADAVLDVWEAQERPAAMLSLSVFRSLDGTEVLHHAQWTGDEAHREWARAHRSAALAPVDAALPGIRRPGLVRYRLDRSHVPDRAAGRPPGLLVTPVFRTSGPAAQRALTDTVLDALDAARVPGLIGAHLHRSLDGSSVRNHAEWADLAAWQAFADGPVPRRIAARIGALDGVTPESGGPDGVHRYRLHGSLVNVAPPT